MKWQVYIRLFSLMQQVCKIIYNIEGKKLSSTDDWKRKTEPRLRTSDFQVQSLYSFDLKVWIYIN